MIDVNALRGKWVTMGYTQTDVAKILNITPKTLYLKLKKGVFDSDEIEVLIEKLQIKNPTEIFFKQQ